MQDPTQAIRDGAKSAIDAACATAGYASTCVTVTNPSHSHALPYIHMQGSVVLPRHNKTHDGTHSIHTYVCWHTKPGSAQGLADVVLQSLTDRSSPITVAGFTLVCSELESMQNVIVGSAPDGEVFGVPVRIRYKTHE